MSYIKYELQFPQVARPKIVHFSRNTYNVDHVRHEVTKLAIFSFINTVNKTCQYHLS